MKKAITAVLCLLLLLTCASAHQGRTDSNGGHWNRATGEYHYHHGYEAHQHPNGICPYSYNNQTDTASTSAPSSAPSINTMSVAYEGGSGDYGPEAETDFETKRDAYNSGFEWGVEYSHDPHVSGSAYNDGYTEGYQQGTQDSYDSAYEDGKNAAFDDAYDKGYNQGYSDAENDFKEQQEIEQQAQNSNLFSVIIVSLIIGVLAGWFIFHKKR